jgi:hypothetical protein
MKRTDVNYVSFPVSPVNVLDRRWSGVHSNNIFSGNLTIEDQRHFLQVLYDELEVSIIKEMEDTNLLSLKDLYTYDTVSKYIDKLYEELHLSIKHFRNRRDSFFTVSLRDKSSWYNTQQPKFVYDCRIPEYRDEESSSNSETSQDSDRKDESNEDSDQSGSDEGGKDGDEKDSNEKDEEVGRGEHEE